MIDRPVWYTTPDARIRESHGAKDSSLFDLLKDEPISGEEKKAAIDELVNDGDHYSCGGQHVSVKGQARLGG